MTTPPDDPPYRTAQPLDPQPPTPTVSEILDRICAEANQASERRLKPGLGVRVHPRTFEAIARCLNAKIEMTIKLHTAAGIVPMTADPGAPEGHPCFDREPTP